MLSVIEEAAIDQKQNENTAGKRTQLFRSLRSTRHAARGGTAAVTRRDTLPLGFLRAAARPAGRAAKTQNLRWDRLLALPTLPIA